MPEPVEVIVDRGVETPPAGGVSAFTVPEEYKEKPYMKDIDSQEKLYKAFDGLQTKLGGRPAGIPGEGSSDEERVSFNKAFGVPESFEKYTRVSLPEGKEQNKDLDAKLMGAIHKAGISDTQFKILEPQFNEIMGVLAGEQQTAAAANDVEFDKIAGEVFGDKRDAVLAASKTLLETHTPERFKADLAALPNKSLLIMAGVLDNIRQKFISEDTPPGQEGGDLPPTNAAAISEQARKLIATDEYTKSMHPGHAAMVERVNNLYKGLKK